MVTTEALSLTLSNLVRRAKAIADDVIIYVVANTRREGALSEDEHATGHLSDGEVNQVLIGLRSAGFRARFFEGELAFIEATTKGEISAGGTAKQLVLSLAQSGRDPARKALIPAFCSLASLPVCNSNGYAMALARNKLHVHCILSRLGLPTPRTWAYDAKGGWLLGDRPRDDIILIAKACREAASIGLGKDSVGVLSRAFEAMLQRQSIELDQPMIVQELIEGYEIEVPIIELDGAPTAIDAVPLAINGEPRLGQRICDFEVVAYDNYQFHSTDVIEPQVVLFIKRTAEAVFTVLGLSGFARVDFRVEECGRAAVIDVATTPHIVYHSSFAHSFRKMGLPHEELLAALVAVNANALGWL